MNWRANTKRTNIAKVLESVAGMAIGAAGAALGILAGLGQTTSTGTSSAIAAALGTSVGNGMLLLYSCFFLLQIAMLGKAFRVTRFAQLAAVFLNTRFLNFFRYSFSPFTELHLTNYLERLAVFLLGMAMISLGFAMVRFAELINYPPESFCTLVAERTGRRFGTVKIALDFVYVALSLSICFAKGIAPDMIREGTLIFAVCNGLLINFYTPYVKRAFRRCEGLPATSA